MLTINVKQFGIDIRNFTKIEKIGHGGFSEVFLAEYKKNGRNYAAKVLKSNVFEREERKKIENEIEIMTNVSHPTIIKYFGYSLLDFCLDQRIVIFTEFAKNGSLSDMIHRAKSSTLPLNFDNTTRQIILIGISCGMRYLHHKNVIHCDLKPKNILLDENYYPHIIDFGVAKYNLKNNSFDNPSLCGTLPYMGPEIFLNKRCTNKVDVYAFGILMYEVICEDDLYPEIMDKQSLTKEFKKKVALSKSRPEFKKEVKNLIKRLIQKCWSQEPSDRPNFDEIFEKLTNNKYFLDNVDEDRVQKYVEEITGNDTTFMKTYDIIQKVEKLSNENKELKEQIRSLKEENEKLSNSCSKLKKKISEIIQKIEVDSNIVIKPENLIENDLSIDLTNLLKLKEKSGNTSPQAKNSPKAKENSNVDPSPRKIIVLSPPKENDEIKYINQREDLSPKKPVSLIKPKEDDIKYINQRENLSPKKSSSLIKPKEEEIKYINQREELTPKKSSSLMKPKEEEIKYINQREEPSPKKSISLMKQNEDEIKYIKQREESPKKSISLLKPKEEEIRYIKQKDELAPKKPASLLQQKEDDYKLVRQREKKSDDIERSPRRILVITQPKEAKEDEIKFINQREEHPPSKPIIFLQNEKINGQFLLTSASPRRIPQFARQKDQEEVNARPPIIGEIKEEKNDDQVVKLPSLMKPKKDESLVTISEFNSYSLQQQQQILRSKVISMNTNRTFIKKPKNQFIINLLKFINYLINFQSFFDPEMDGYIEIRQCDTHDDKLDNITRKDQVNILHKTTEILYYNNILISDTFREMVRMFKFIAIEIRYFSKIFQDAYKIVLSLKRVFINIFISGIKKTDNTFKGNKFIDSIRFDNSVSIINDYAFQNCSELNQVKLSSSITSIGSGAFEGCSSLQSVSIPSSVTFIDFSVFKGCSDLTEVCLPSSIKLIRSNAFYGCSSLKTLSIPSSVTSIGDYAFYSCSALETVSIPSSVTSLGEFSFGKCSSLKQIVIPTSVSSIGKSSFDGCLSLEQIKIPNSIKNLNELNLNKKTKITRI
ncbi:hypothetical protein M9Y10_026031 [Tritrichomonas musculus]|uniref:Protein kinase domain-containing protein n=1 Tax=Tritrichomonas musculus TaxID=1915356 RepID=A0ABR2H8B0_9EUKA